MAEQQLFVPWTRINKRTGQLQQQLFRLLGAQATDPGCAGQAYQAEQEQEQARGGLDAAAAQQLFRGKDTGAEEGAEVAESEEEGSEDDAERAASGRGRNRQSNWHFRLIGREVTDDNRDKPVTTAQHLLGLAKLPQVPCCCCAVCSAPSLRWHPASDMRALSAVSGQPVGHGRMSLCSYISRTSLLARLDQRASSRCHQSCAPPLACPYVAHHKCTPSWSQVLGVRVSETAFI